MRRQWKSAGAGLVTAGALLMGVSASAQAQERPWTERMVPAPSNAVELKAGVGYTQGFGMIAPGRSVPDTAGAGLGVNADLDYRVDPRWSIGLQAEYQEFNPNTGLDTNARGVAGNIGVTYHGMPFLRGDPWLRLGTGYRALWDFNPTDQPRVGTEMLQGWEALKATVGYDMRLSEGVAIAPVVGADLDVFGGRYQDGSFTALPTAQVGTFIFAGVQGRFDAGGSETPAATVARNVR